MSRVEPGPVKGNPPTLEWVAVGSLEVDPTYQRETDGPQSGKIIAGMVKAWQWTLCQPLVVSRRPDGRQMILDGQHRHAGAVARGDIPHLPCVIVTGCDVQTEAKTFVALNTERQKLAQSDIFNGMLAAGDPEAKIMADILAETGWKQVRMRNLKLAAPGSLLCAPMLVKHMKAHGAAPIRNALTALREAYPDTPVSNAATLLKALIALYAGDDMAGADPDLFIEALGAIEPNGWEDEGQDYRRNNPSVSRVDAIAAAMMDACRDLEMDKAA